MPAFSQARGHVFVPYARSRRLWRFYCFGPFFLEGKPCLHAVCRDTNFGAATVIPSKSTNPSPVEVWLAFLKFWILLYTGPPHSVRHDPGTNFDMKEFRFLLATNGIEPEVTPVESHRSNGQVESAHGNLRKLTNHLRNEARDLPLELILQLARKAMNDVAGPDGLSPTLLAFGTPARDPYAGLSVTLPRNEIRFRLMARSRELYRALVNGTRLQRLLHTSVPPAADTIYRPGDLCFVWREISPTKGIYRGHFAVVELSDDRVRVAENDEGGTWFSKDQCRKLPETPCALPGSGETPDPVEGFVAAAATSERHQSKKVFVTEVVPLDDPPAH